MQSRKVRTWRTANPAASTRNNRALLERRRRNDPKGLWLSRIKKRALEKGLEFNLDIEDLEVPGQCPLLGIPIKLGVELPQNDPSTPSLDRVDPTKGYVKGNVRVISFKANAMKQDASKEQLLLFAINIVEYMK